jgi:hypothetical protein
LRLPARFFRVRPSCDIFRDCQFEVVAQFVVQVLIGLFSTKERP